MDIKKLKIGESILLQNSLIRVGVLLSNKNDGAFKLIAFLIPKKEQWTDAIFSGRKYSKLGEVILLGCNHHGLFEVDLLTLFEKYHKLVFAIIVNNSQVIDAKIHLESVAIIDFSIKLNQSEILRFGEIYQHNGNFKFKHFQDVFTSLNKFSENYGLLNIKQMLIGEEDKTQIFTTFIKDSSRLIQIFDSDPKIIKFKVAIIGAKGVGKTSLLVAMHDQLTKIHSLGEVRLESVDTASRMQVLLEKMLSQYSASESFINMPLKDLSSNNLYRYRVMPIFNKFVLTLEICELESAFKENMFEKAAELIKNSDVVMLAIDTPALMEDNSRWHESVNEARTTIDCFKSALVNINKNKLVLLVPVKCEYYFYDKDYRSLLTIIQQRYAGLLNFFHHLDRSVALAITPVQTLGNVHLFEILEDNDRLPTFIFEQHPELPTYSPRDADQLLVYILNFVLSEMKSIYRVNTNSEEMDKLCKMQDTLLQHRKQGAEGYKIVQGFRLLS